MKYLSYARSGKPFYVYGEKQANRQARRSGLITSRQQKKEIKIHRRKLKEQ